MHRCVQVSEEAREGCWIFPELELQVTVRHVMWALGTELRFSGGAGRLLNG